MTWSVLLGALVASLLGAMLTGTPVAFAFLIVNLITSLVIMGSQGPQLLTLAMIDSVANFALTPIPLFVLMGAVLFHSGVIIRTVDRVSEWMGRVPGRLALIAIAAGTVLGLLSGSTMATTALLGSLLLPDMLKRGYNARLAVGSIMASGGLSMILPPSSLAIVYATVAKISVGDLLIAGIIPGLVMATIYVVTIVTRVSLQPALAPGYEVTTLPLGERLRSLLRDVVPVAILLFLVLGLMLLGVATPTESAALGAVGAMVVAAAYGRLNAQVIRRSLVETVKVSGMMMLIIAGAAVYSQLLAFSGASRGLVQFVLGLPLSPAVIMATMLGVVFVLGFFMEQMAVIMITVPLYTVVLNALGADQLWFGVLMMICLQIGLTTPPFGLILFVVKGMFRGVSTSDIYRAAVPFVLCDVFAMLLLWFWPRLVTWLPAVIR